MYYIFKGIFLFTMLQDVSSFSKQPGYAKYVQYLHRSTLVVSVEPPGNKAKELIFDPKISNNARIMWFYPG